jgi:hypothetical protein
MREIRLSGSEGGGTEFNRFSLPLSSAFSLLCRATLGGELPRIKVAVQWKNHA